MNMSEERELQHQIVALLRAAGWYVRVFSAHRSAPRQIAGWVDVVAFRHGVTLLIECKSRSGRLRDDQLAFAESIAPHLCDTLRYVVARSLDDVIAVI